MRLQTLAYRFFRSSLALTLVLSAILLGFVLRAWALYPGHGMILASGASGSAEMIVSLHAVAEIVLALSYFILAGAFLSLYQKCKGLLSFRAIFLIFALFAVASGLMRVVSILMHSHKEFAYSAELEMVAATLAVVTAGIVAGLVGRARKFLLTAKQSQRNEARFIAASESSLEAFYTLHSVRGPDGLIIDFEFTYLNRNGEKLIGLPREEILGKYLCKLIPLNREGGFFDEYKQVVMSGEPVVQEFPMQLEGETPRWIRHEVVRLEDGIAITAADITDRKLSEQLIEHRAHHDILTNLPNRSLLNDRVQQALDRAIRYKNKVGLFLVDMDLFKEINDNLGHTAGDLVLVTVAQRLRDSVRATDSVLRIGGDEFIVVMPDVHEERDIRRMAGKIIMAVSNGGPPGLEKVTMSCSIGISIFPTQAPTAEQLFANADAAMYQAKRRGGGCYEVFSETTPAFHAQITPKSTRPSKGRPVLVLERPDKRQTTSTEV